MADALDWLNQLPEAEQAALLAEAKAELARFQLADYEPYPKQADFHRAGADPAVLERLLMAGNQLGKTWCAGAETAYHLTGEYPEGWDGAVFDHPVSGWAASETSQGTRDTVQRILLGKIGEWGTGAIPAHAILEIKRATGGVADFVETILVRHKSGGTSRITLKTYDQGRERWQGETLDFVWFDEEPPLDIYIEGKTRTNATQGIVYLTFTPLKGMSDVVMRFLMEKVPGTHVTSMTIHDALHYTPEQRAAIIAGYPAHERDARSNGIPTLGSGRIFPVNIELLKVPAFPIPAHWPRIAGIDFGWDHPTAGAWLAWDRDSDTVYVTDAYRQSEQPVAVHATTFRAKSDWMPVAWPHDGENETAAGGALATQYRKAGLQMLKAKATNPPDKGKEEGTGGNKVEPGIAALLDRMLTGRFKVFSHLEIVFQELQLYHRKDGKIVKLNDDTLSAIRYAHMMLRHAKTKPVEEVFAEAWEPADAGAGY